MCISVSQRFPIVERHFTLIGLFCRATNMNLHSSRSHAIFIITVECSQVGPRPGRPEIIICAIFSCLTTCDVNEVTSRVCAHVCACVEAVQPNTCSCAQSR